MKNFTSLLLLAAALTQFASNAHASCPADSTSNDAKQKAITKGNWRGISFNALSMAQFQGNLEDYSATWGARPDLGLITDDAAESFRVSFNPFEKRQKILGEFFGLTTGIGGDWIRLSVQENRRLRYDESLETVLADTVNTNNYDVRINRLNAVYLRVPLLASVHLFRSGGEGLHVEGGIVGGYLIHGKYNRSYRLGNTETVTEEDFPIAPLQISARLGVGFGKVSLLGEAALLPFFDENPADSPSMHSFTVGLQIALSD
jgi:hypothetical protein